MAILPILDKPETKYIIEVLEDNKPLSPSELNEVIVNGSKTCSTATLYRRLKELHIAGVLVFEDGKYSLTELGNKLNVEIKRQEAIIEEKKILEKESNFGFSHKNYLRSIGTKPFSKHEYQQTFQKSPTEISTRFKDLLNLGLIEQTDQAPPKKKSRGRPKKKFRLTNKGKEMLDNLSKVDELIEGGPENED